MLHPALYVQIICSMMKIVEHVVNIANQEDIWIVHRIAAGVQKDVDVVLTMEKRAASVA